MSCSNEKATRFKCWGDEMLNKLPGISRKSRKRHASKIRRQRKQSDLSERRRDASL